MDVPRFGACFPCRGTDNGKRLDVNAITPANDSYCQHGIGFVLRRDQEFRASFFAGAGRESQPEGVATGNWQLATNNWQRTTDTWERASARLESIASPADLVALLHAQDAASKQLARQWFEENLANAVKRLVERIIPSESLDSQREQAVESTLRWLEAYARARPARDFAGLSWKTFHHLMLLGATRLLQETFFPSRPLGEGIPARREERSLPAHPQYRTATFFQPYEHVGGDWYEGEVTPDGALWVIVADVTGHGPMAHLMVQALQLLWRTRQVTNLRAATREPRELLALLALELCDLIPFGVFVESTLARLEPNGTISVAAAGACPVALRRAGDTAISFHFPGGNFLGIPIDDPVHGQCEWQLSVGDEILLASDGLFDPLNRRFRLHSPTATIVLNEFDPLHQSILRLLQETLLEQPHHDDITVVTLRFDQSRGETDLHVEV